MRHFILSLKNLLRPAVPERFAALAALLLVFLAFNAAVRLGLAFFNGDFSVFFPWNFVPVMLIGAFFDAVAASFVLAPLALLLALVRTTRWPVANWLFAVLLLPLSVLMVFTGFSEFTFWNEFASRFNFIAVDYLIYTSEVIGNIRESYNLPLLLSGVAVIALVIWWVTLRRVAPLLRRPLVGWKATGIALAFWLAAPLVGYVVADARYKEFSNRPQINDLSGNGYFEFWHAFWHNEIDYDRFYKTIPRPEAVQALAAEMTGAQVGAPSAEWPQVRQVNGAGPQKDLNVVMVSIESFSAEFMKAYGQKQELTPNMDRLAREGMNFTRLYATGTRTVRGLEALTLSVPPTPGHSIVKRPENDDLFSIGGVFKEKGYEPLYIYGGYSYFDNMEDFFGGIGYTVIDRSALSPQDIHFENIWGVADEDLFTLALREIDARHAAGKKFFAHVMTTSNHRPFTYPEGRIDIPSHSGREGGVKYTDFAIGQFVERARAKPWFKDTVFVFVADHTHKGRGLQELPAQNYHIPMIIYAPAHIAPQQVNSLASQIDVAPTILGLLNMSYRSKFFGQDILREGQARQRAFLANYQTVGLHENGRTVELKPNGRVRVVDASNGKAMTMDAQNQGMVQKTIAYYQLAAEAFSAGAMRKD